MLHKHSQYEMIYIERIHSIIYISINMTLTYMMHFIAAVYRSVSQEVKMLN